MILKHQKNTLESTKMDNKNELAKAGQTAPANAEVNPMQLITLAMEKGADVENLTKLMELQERWEANEARKAFVSAMNEFKSKDLKIVKNNNVNFRTSKGTTNYDHATLDFVIAKISPEMTRLGLSWSWSTDNSVNGQIGVTCKITHVMGHSEETKIFGPSDQSGGKNAIQAIGSTVTYLQRYTLLSILGLTTGGDTDGIIQESVEFISKEQIAMLELALTETGRDSKKFLAVGGYESFEQIPASDFENGMNLIKGANK